MTKGRRFLNVHDQADQVSQADLWPKDAALNLKLS
jgi:hypothetical protein